MSKITIQLSANLKEKPADEDKLAFGKQMTDHMFIMDYMEGQGWHDARIVPYGPISMDPASTCLHYGQLVFEGMKAYRTDDGRVLVFRPYENWKRMNLSNDRLCIARIDEDLAMEGLAALLRIEKDWIPSKPGTSLYVRPFIISTDNFLGVHPSKTYRFMIILSPSGAYYEGGMAPVKIYVEKNYVRTVRGGTGYTKCAGNYAASLKSQVEAEEEGYAQVLWLDGVERRFIEEVGSMNVFFVIDGKVVTPALLGSVLAGITRKSVIELLKKWDVPVEERQLSIEELHQAHQEGRLIEAFGTGTAAVISPIGELKWGDVKMEIGGGKIGSLTQKLYDTITGIQLGKLPDPDHWTCEVCRY